MSGTTEAIATHKGRRALDRGDALVLTGVTGGHAISHFLYQSFLVMLPTVRDALGIGPVQVGAIMTARELASGLTSLPGGLICDRLRRHWGAVLALCMVGFGLGWLIVGLSQTYVVLVIGMMLTSVAASLWHLPAMAALSQRFSRRRGTALSIHGVGGNLGDVLGPILTGFMLGYLSWRGVLGVYVTIPLLVAVMVIWAFRDVGANQDSEASQPSIRTQVAEARLLLRDATIWQVNAVSALHGMCYQVYTTFLPLYLADELGLDARGIGLYLGLLFSFGIVANPLMGYLSDRVGRKAIIIPTLVGSCVFSLLLALLGQGSMFVVIIFVLGIFLRSDFSLLSAAALDIVGHRVATTTLGVLSFSRCVMGAISPLIGGVLYERWGMDAALYYVAALFALATVVFALARMEKASPA